MTTRSKRASDETRGDLEVKSEAGSELEELNEEEYERERLENIKYVSVPDHYICNLLLQNTKPAPGRLPALVERQGLDCSPAERRELIAEITQHYLIP